MRGLACRQINLYCYGYVSHITHVRCAIHQSVTVARAAPAHALIFASYEAISSVLTTSSSG
eukprot:COSAG02_NODE_190_length_30025_cov_22.989875_8_plen_61_part_00